MGKRMAKGKSEEHDDDEGKGFYACYLLTSLSPRFKGHTYIGFTVNPRRRIRQHNGEIRSGAFRTKKGRPWEMVFCIYGFPTNVSALQFEWAWQHPMESLAVRQAAAFFKSFSGVANKIKLAYTMLNLPAWRSLNITINFFSTKYSTHSAACTSLPEHMKVKVSPIGDLPCYSTAEDEVSGNESYDSITSLSEARKESTVKLQCHSIDGIGCNDSKDDYSVSDVSSGNSHDNNVNYESYGFNEEYGMRQQGSTSAEYPPILEVDDARLFSPLVRTAENPAILEVDDARPFSPLVRTSFLSAGFASHEEKAMAVEIEVIDLLSPSPDCRIMSSRKRRRVLNVCPQIIDLT
ncbi:structure-specific endonuclease subunit SLX1 [Mercurialis annua]|uniref:structure-specific endonuclease subunit SLX1 n=1 Tax=Mercurialis annua TaxID=3986 RepID=UPI00215DD54A|nr:structure-specific endonuclease subunit SLX1 [Mercurialis annua]